MSRVPFKPQFSLRTVLLVITLLAILLAWRFGPQREAAAVAAIQAAGGKVYFRYQEPSDSYTYFSFGMLPECEYFGQVDIRVNGPATPPPPTWLECLTGMDEDLAVHTVELRLEQLTPQLAAQVGSLTNLQRIVLVMPAGVLEQNSPEVQRLHELQAEFPDKVFATFKLGN